MHPPEARPGSVCALAEGAKTGCARAISGAHELGVRTVIRTQFRLAALEARPWARGCVRPAATRKPMLLSLSSCGSLSLRLARRALRAVLFQLPPRSTRRTDRGTPPPKLRNQYAPKNAAAPPRRAP